MGEYPTIPKEEYLERIDQAREGAARQGFDSLLVISRGGGSFVGHENVFYLAGHYPTFPVCLPPEMGRGHTALLIPVDGDPTLLVDTSYYRKEWVAVSDVRVWPDLYTGVIESVKSLELEQSRVGIVGSGVVTMAAKQRLDSELPKISWGAADEIVENARMVKSLNELDVMRRVGKAATAVGNTFLENVQEGITEGDIAAEVSKTMLKNGAEVYAYYLTSDWHPIRWPMVNQDRILTKGDLVHFDIWGAVDGYIFDFSRSTLVGGDGTKEKRRLMEVAEGTVKVALDEMKVGMKINDWVKKIEKHLERLGYLSEVNMTGVPTGFYGHGMGLAMEAPWVIPGDNTELVEGMCFAVERTMSIEGIGAAMYEENIILNKDGFEMLTQVPRGF